MMHRIVALSHMAYNPETHRRLDELSEKYGSWYLSQLHAAHEGRQPILNADGIESTLSDCYEDALVTAHALYVYLSDNPNSEDQGSPRGVSVSRPLQPPVDVLDDAVDVSSGEDEQRDGVDHRRVGRARPAEVAAEHLAGSDGEQVSPPARHRLKLRDRFTQRRALMGEAGGRSVQGDLEPDVGTRTTAL